MAVFTSSFHYDVSLHGGTPPSDSPNTFIATLLIQLAILFHVVFGPSWVFQSASCTTRFIKTPWLSSFSRQHLILGSKSHSYLDIQN